MNDRPPQGPTARGAQADKARPRRRCPICGKPTVEAWRPFCAKRCADIDLGRWLGERYRVPAEAGEDESDVPEEGDEESPGDPPRL
ncbi:MAG: DNA gyrase inhibitor YacG [Rhodospirillaceae bacterium]|nr:DNA gyrase inhibitor YacG [Rhodospirillaceae bacterium]